MTKLYVYFKSFGALLICIGCILSSLHSFANTFIGREAELRHLQEMLRTTNFITITGVSGIGKTSLAKEFSKLSANKYDFVWWFYEERNFEEDLMRLGHYLSQKYEKAILHPHYNKRLNLDRVLNYLKTSNHKALLIFDNFFTLKNINSFINSKNITFVITSLSRFDRGKTMVLKKLSRKSSIELIKRQIDCSSDDANLLAETLQDHPLALTQAIMYISTRKGLNVEKYLEFYNQSMKKLWQNEEKLKKEGNMDKTVYSTVIMVLDRLKKTNYDSYELLQYFLPYHKSVPISVLKKVYLEHIKADELSFIEAIKCLTMHSLIEEDNKVTDSFSCHDIIAKALRVYAEENFNLRLGHLVQQCKTIFSPFLNIPTLFSIYREGIYEYMENVALEGIKRDIIDSDYFLCILFEYTICGSKDYQEARKVMELLESYYTKSKKYNKAHLSYYHTLKGLYYALSEADYTKSNAEYEKAISIVKEYPKNFILKAFPQILMANNYCYVSDLEKANTLIKEASSVLKKQNTPILKDGMVFTQAQIYLYEGLFDEALSTIIKGDKVAILSIKKPLQPYHVEWLILYSRILNNLGKAQEGYQILKNTRDAFSTVIGSKIHDTYVTLCIALIESCFYLKDLEGMKLYMSEAKKYIQQIYDQEEISQAEYYQFKGDYYLLRSQYQDALDQYRISGRIYSKIFVSMKHIYIKRLWKNLARVYAKLGLNQEYDQCLSKYREIFGDEDLKEIISFVL